MNKREYYVREALDWALHIGAAVLIALLIVHYVAQLTVVIGKSMEPTLKNDNKLIMEKISKRFDKIQRGDIVVVEAKAELQSHGVPPDHSPLIKRVIGLPGDRVQVVDGKVYVNGTLLVEHYINGDFTDNGTYSDVTVAPHKVFVMGDNRKPSMSIDSRILGAFDNSKIIGRVFLRISPLNEFGGLPR